MKFYLMGKGNCRFTNQKFQQQKRLHVEPDNTFNQLVAGAGFEPTTFGL